MKENNLTDMDEVSFVKAYSNPQKAAQIHQFMVENKLTDLDANAFYSAYFDPSKKKGGTTQGSEQPGKPSAPSFGQKITEKITNSASQTQIPLKTGLQQEEEKRTAEKKAKIPTSKYFEVDIQEKPEEIKAPKFADPIVVAKSSRESKAIFNSVIGDKDVYKMPTRGEANEYASDITKGYLDYLELVRSEKSDTYKEKYNSLKAKPKADRSAQDEEFLRQVEAEAVGAFYDAKEQELSQLSNDIDNLQKVAVTDEQKAELNNLYGQYEKKRDSLIGTSSVYQQNKLQYGKIAGKEMVDEEAKLRRFEALQAGDGKTIEFFKGIGGAVANGVLSIGQVPKVFGDLIGDTDYDWSDQMYDMISGQKSDLDREFGAPLPKGKKMSDLPFTARLAVVGGNAIGSAALFAAGGSLGGATSLGQSAATFGTAFLTSEADYYQEALDAGMSPQQAAAAGTFLAAQTALIESIIPDVKYFEPSAFRKSVMQAVASGVGKGLPVKEAAKLALKNTLKALPESSLSYAKTATKEAGEEFLGQVGEDVGKQALNAMGKRQYFNDTFNPESYTDAILGGFIAGGGMSVFSRPTAKSPIQEETMREMVERQPQEERKGTASDKIGGEGDLKDFKDATSIFNALSSHSGWNVMSREEQNHAFALAQQAAVMKKEQAEMKKINMEDEAKNEQIKQLENEVNEMFSAQTQEAKDKAKQAKIQSIQDNLNEKFSMQTQRAMDESKQSKVKEIEDEFNKSIQGEEFPVQEDERDQEIIALQKKREDKGISEIDTFLGDMKPVVPFAVERMEQGLPVAQSVKQAASNYLYKKYKELTDMKSNPNRMMTRQQISNVQKQLEQDIRTLEGTAETKIQTNDQENIQGVSGEVGKGQEPVTTQPVEGTSEETTPTGGVLQTQEEVSPTTGAAPVSDTGTNIQKVETLRTEEQAELAKSIPNIESYKVNGKIDKSLMTPKDLAKYNEIYDKYDKLITPLLPTTKATPETAPKPTKPSFKERVGRMFNPQEAKAAEDIARFHKEAGIDVQIIDDVEAQRLGQERNIEGSVQGLFLADKDSGVIYLNRDALKRQGSVLAYHEGIHPVINIIRNTNPELYKKVIDGLRAEAKRNPAIARAIRQVEAVKEYQKRGAETIEDETIVEVLARIASGMIDLNKVDKSFKDNMIEFLNKIAKALRLPTINANASTQQFRDFANKLSTALTQGGTISDVVGKENVKQFSPPPSLSITDEEAQELIVPGSQILGTPSIGQASIADSRIEGFDTKPFKAKGVPMKYSKPRTMEDVLSESGGAAVFVNSDGTKVGVVTINGKKYTIQGGLDYTFIKKNVDENVGFAASENQKISTLNSMAKGIAEMRDQKTPQHKGKPVAVFVVSQNGEAMLGEWYAGEYIMEGIDKALTEGTYEGGVAAAKEQLSNAIRDVVITTKTEDGKTDNKARNKLIEMIQSNLFDTHIGRMKIADFLSSKEVSFGLRSKINGEILAANPKMSGRGKNRELKKALADAGHHMEDFWKLFADERFLPAIKKERLVPEKGKVFANKTFSGFYYNPFVSIEEQIEHTQKGVKHRQFNSKFMSVGSPFLLTQAHDVNKLFPDMGYADSDGYEIYNKANKTDIGKKSNISDRLKVSEWLNKNGYQKNVINPYSSISLSIYTGYVTDEYKGKGAKLPPSKIKGQASVDIDRSDLKSKKYPLEDKGKWYGDEDYKERGGVMTEMTPKEFLSRSKPLDIDDEARDNIDTLKEQILNGGKLDPLAIYSNDKSKTSSTDGRHRAVAAQELGIKSVPVIDFTQGKNIGQASVDIDRSGPEGQPLTEIDGQTTFFHASSKKREGRLKPNMAPQWGKAIYFATSRQAATDEFGGQNVTEVSLSLKNPVYTNSKEFKAVNEKAAELYNKAMLPQILKDEAELVNGEWRFFDEDLQAEYDKNGYIDKYSSSDIEEGKYFGEAAQELGYDAIIDQDNQYGTEIAVLDENAVVYPEDIKEMPKGQFSADIERTSDETRQSMEDAGDAIEQAIASGTDPQKAVDDIVGSKDWYKNLNKSQKEQFDEILQEYFGASPKVTAKKPTGVKAAISNIVDNYYKIKDGTRAEKTAARDAINQILDSDPKLKYIYNNIRDINKQLQAAGVITEKTDGCP